MRFFEFSADLYHPAMAAGILAGLLGGYGSGSGSDDED